MNDTSIEQIVEALLDLAETVEKREEKDPSTPNDKDSDQLSSAGELGEMNWLPGARKLHEKPE